MIVRRIPKPALQAMLKALRAAQLNVTKTNGIYTCTNDDAQLLLRAMPGSRDYLVRMVPDLFEVSA